MKNNEEFTNLDPEQQEIMSSLEEFDSNNFKEGQNIQGTVIDITKESVIVDINYKSEGHIPIAEFDNNLPARDDIIEVRLLSLAIRNGSVSLSYSQAVRERILAGIEEGSVVEALITKAIKGGFQAKLAGEILAFVPHSQMDNVRVENESVYINNKFNFLVKKVGGSNSRPNIVLSRRELLETEIEQVKEEFFATQRVGNIVDGIVKNITSFGAFIDLGGFSGLLHNNDLSWDRTKKLDEVLSPGDKKSFKIMSLEQKNMRIGLSLKALEPSPWDDLLNKYKVDDIISGKVIRLQDYGAFVEIEAGVDGLIHVSELSWIKHVKHPKEILKKGDQIEAKILDIDIENNRISLGLRQTLPNPWDDLADRYPIGTKITRSIKNIIASGLFLDLEDGITGFLSNADFSWERNEQEALSQKLSEGTEIEVLILEIDKENRKVRFGMKQLSANPWDAVSKLKKGNIIEGAVSRIVEFGIFINISDKVEALVHRSEIPRDQDNRDLDLAKHYPVGTHVRAIIIGVELKRHKISLSIKELQHKEEKQEISKYLYDDTEDSNTFSMGSILKKDK